MKHVRPITLVSVFLGATVALLALLLLLVAPNSTAAGPLLAQAPSGTTLTADAQGGITQPAHEERVWHTYNEPVNSSQFCAPVVSQAGRSYAPDEGELVLNINYSHDWVEGNYEPGYTVWLTVTNSSGDVKATAEMVTAVIPWWGGNSGFSTNLDNPWQPQHPDIQPGDWVHGAVDNGYRASVQVGLITGNVDMDADSITGTVDAAWLLPGPVDVECLTWGAPGDAPHKQDTVIPDGSDTYVCAWDPDSEWDVQPGQDIAVLYREPGGHQIYGVFSAVCPDFSHSGLVDVSDIMQAAARWNNPAAYDPTYDVASPFGSPIDILDIIGIAELWNIACP